MESLTQFILKHQASAPLIAFALLLLAGLSVPISIDLVVLSCAFLTATVIPEYTIPLLCTLFVGCCCSAWLAYWMGRIGGNRLLKTRWFSKLFPLSRVEKIRQFYQKHGLLTLIIGRFIPFGVRNCIFLSTGLSRSSFTAFMWRDCLSCLLWVPSSFFLFYLLSTSYEALTAHLKNFHLYLFIALNVTGIAIFWYKRKQKEKHRNTPVC